MTEDGVRRLFFALWPDAAGRAGLVALQGQLVPGTGRLVQGDNLHITLLYLGATPTERQRCLEEALNALRCAAFRLCLDHLGHWRKPQVLWAGASETPAALATLVQQLREVAAACGCEVESRPYQTHLTLCRKVRNMPRDLPVMTAPISWVVDGFVLAESITAASGVQYRIMREWRLAALGDGAPR